MAFTPDSADIPSGNQTPLVDRAARLNAEMQELGKKIAEVVRESQKLLDELSSDGPPPDPA